VVKRKIDVQSKPPAFVLQGNMGQLLATGQTDLSNFCGGLLIRHITILRKE